MQPRKRKHDLNTLFRRVGEISVAWAFLELAVDLCIETIHTSWGGETLSLEIPKTSFARKMRYIRDWYESNAVHAELFPNFLESVAQLEEMSEHRHRLIHGIAINFSEYELTGMATVYRRMRKKSFVRAEETTYNVRHLTKFRNQIVQLGIFVGWFEEILAGRESAKYDRNNSFRDLADRISGILPRAN